MIRKQREEENGGDFEALSFYLHKMSQKCSRKVLEILKMLQIYILKQYLLNNIYNSKQFQYSYFYFHVMSCLN